MASEAITRNDLTNILNEVLPSTSVVSNAWSGSTASAYSTTTPYTSGGLDIISTNYTTNTGHFVVIASALLKTSRYTSSAIIKVDGTAVGSANTNKTTSTTLVPSATYKGTKGATYNVALAIASQDSGTTASTEQYNANTLVIFDISDSNNGITPMADYIVEQGTDGIWTYRKWASGIAECWGKTEVASYTYAANGGSKAVIEYVPSGLFISNPIMVETRGYISTNVRTITGFSYCDTSYAQTYLINNDTSAKTQGGGVYWNIRGRWK